MVIGHVHRKPLDIVQRTLNYQSMARTGAVKTRHSVAHGGSAVEDPELSALARVGTALADDTRRRILVSLLDGPAYPSDLADRLGASRPNISNHLACLRGCGLVTSSTQGRRHLYELSDPRLRHALTDLCSMVLAPPSGCEVADEDSGH